MEEKYLKILASEENQLHIIGIIVFDFQGTKVASVQHMTYKLNYSTIIHLN